MGSYVGNVLQKLRNGIGYSVEKLADYLVVEDEVVEEWEEGISEPTSREWTMLCQLYGYSLGEMFDMISGNMA